jgi:DNA-binding transcriptional LysR family regulator
MNLAQLRTFVIVADAGGVTRAVARLRLSQPAISRQILALEGDLGSLFLSRRTASRLTPDGEDLLGFLVGCSPKRSRFASERRH